MSNLIKLRKTWSKSKICCIRCPLSLTSKLAFSNKDNSYFWRTLSKLKSKSWQIILKSRSKTVIKWLLTLSSKSKRSRIKSWESTQPLSKDKLSSRTRFKNWISSGNKELIWTSKSSFKLLRSLIWIDTSRDMRLTLRDSLRIKSC